MSDRRRFPRYDVGGLVEFKGELGSGRKLSKLVMFGLGGCGFFSSPQEDLLKDKMPIDCLFTCEKATKAPALIKGKIAYSQLLTIEGKKKVFYGVEFDLGQDLKLNAFIRYLEELAKTGKIRVCA
jgi:hypothetical protein